MNLKILFLFISILLSNGPFAQQDVNNRIPRHNTGSTHTNKSTYLIGLLDTDNGLLKGHPTPLDSSKTSIKGGYYTLPDKEKSLYISRGFGKEVSNISKIDLPATSAMAEGKMHKNALLSNEVLKDSLLPVTVATSFKLDSPSISASWDVKVTTDKEFPVCREENIKFTTNISTSGSVSFTKIRWDFGDGTIMDDTNTGQNTYSHTYTYPKAGTYTLSVIPYDGENPILDEVKTVEVKISSCAIPVNPNIHIWK